MSGPNSIITEVAVDDEQQTGTPVSLPLGSKIVGARRNEYGGLWLDVIHGAKATIPHTVAIHVVQTGGTVPARGSYITTIRHPLRTSLADHIFVGPWREQ